MRPVFSYGHDAARVQTCLLEHSVNSHSQTCLNLCHIILYEKWVPKHEDCLWDIVQLALDCVSSVFCDLPLAILMRSGTLTSVLALQRSSRTLGLKRVQTLQGKMKKIHPVRCANGGRRDELVVACVVLGVLHVGCVLCRVSITYQWVLHAATDTMRFTRQFEQGAT